MAIYGNLVNMLDIKGNDVSMDRVYINGTLAWLRPYSYTRGTLPTGVASISAEIDYSAELYAERSLATTDTIYVGEYINITATPSTGYNNPSIGAVPNPISGNVIGANYVSAGSKQTFTIVFNSQSGSAVPSQTVEYGQYFTYPTSTRTGYSLDGWYTSTSYITPYNFGTAVTSDAYVYAKWAINVYTVVFKDYNGTVLSTQYIAYGSSATAPSNPTRSSTAQYSYAFNGWDTSFSNVTSNLTITAQYTATLRSYTVTFYDDDSTTVLKTQSVAYGSSATAPTSPTKASTAQYSYAFSSWNGDYTGITGAVNVYAVYTATLRSYTLTISSISHVASQTISRTSSPYGGASTGTLSNGATIYYGDVLSVSASASTAYNNPSVTTPITVSGNVATSSYITAGSVKSYTLTVSTITGISLTYVNRSSSPYGGGSTGSNLTTGATLYYGDVIDFDAQAASGYDDPTYLAEQITVYGNVTTSNYIAAGEMLSYSATITGYNQYDSMMGGQFYEDGVFTPNDSMTVTSGSFSGKRNTSTYSVGYIIKNGTTTKMSGTSSGFTLTSTQCGYLNGTSAITIRCTSPMATSIRYYYSAKLIFAYHY